MSSFFLGVSWKICFVHREVIKEEHNICVIHSYFFFQGLLNITEFRKGYPNKTLHPCTFLKTPEKRIFLGFEVKNYLITGVDVDIKWNGCAQSQMVLKSNLQFVVFQQLYK